MCLFTHCFQCTLGAAPLHRVRFILVISARMPQEIDSHQLGHQITRVRLNLRPPCMQCTLAAALQHVARTPGESDTERAQKPFVGGLAVNGRWCCCACGIARLGEKMVTSNDLSTEHRFLRLFLKCWC